jgi:hypothetical protein
VFIQSVIHYNITIVTDYIWRITRIISIFHNNAKIFFFAETAFHEAYSDLYFSLTSATALKINSKNAKPQKTPQPNRKPMLQQNQTAKKKFITFIF